MRKAIFVGFIAAGALIGLFSAANDDWATRVVMMGVGVLFGAPLGALFTGLGARRDRNQMEVDSELPGMGTSPKDLAANFWRDKGHPPFMKPTEAKPDSHMFDPDKLD
jgi:hypothetical protein